jgi:hypothetical protein
MTNYIEENSTLPLVFGLLLVILEVLQQMLVKVFIQNSSPIFIIITIYSK